MSPPTVTVRVAFASNPYATPTWTDISNYVQAFECTRGRSFELDDFDAGTATVVLDNLDRRFDPTYTGSPYSPNVKPRKRINIRATFNAVTYDLFTGFVDAWPPSYPGPLDSDVVLTATDGFKMLSRSAISTTYPQHGAGERIGAVLDSVGWPSADRALDAGYSACQATTLTGTSALDHMRLVRDSEQGFLFVNGAGLLTFQGRYRRYTSPYTTSQATFGELTGSGELLYVSVKPSFDDAHIFNAASVTRAGGAEQVASDSGSQTSYGLSAFSKSGLLNATDNDAGAIANYVVARYAQPQLRIDQIVLDGEADPTHLWPQMLGREISDRVTVKRRPPGGGSAISQDCHIEQITHSYSVANDDWRTSWMLSPADTTTYFVIDSSSVNGAAVLAW